MSDVFLPNPHAAFYFETPGRLKLTVLSEDRLQMKWKEADGPVQGYKVRVRPISGEAAAQTPLSGVCKKNTAVFSLMERCSVWTQEERQEGKMKGLLRRGCVAHPVFQKQILLLLSSNESGKNAEIKCKKRCKDQQNSFPPEQIT